MVKPLIKKLIPSFLLSWYHLGLAVLGAVLYGFPSKKLTVVGITGTNGKSTVVDLTTKIFEAPRDPRGKKPLYKVASLSSIKFKIGEKEWQNTLKMTMPGRFKLQKFLRDAVDAGCKYAVIEVTSEGIKQWRHWGIDFDVAVFTNLTKEHIESHGSFEKYREAKSALFKALARNRHRTEHETDTKHKKISIINLDDENAEYFLQFPADEVYGYAVNRQQTTDNRQQTTYELRVTDYGLLTTGVQFTVDNTEFNLKLHGRFNIYNALAAICVGLSQGIDMSIIKKAFEGIEEVPGRFEVVIEKPFTTIVDYAHTPDALENVYETVRSLVTNHHPLITETICVLGAAGGGRDKWKRPEFGKVAEKYCDKIILTNEDPYDENPDSILAEIESGFSQIRNSPPSLLLRQRLRKDTVKLRRTGKHQPPNLIKILDRREAIRTALSLAKQGDIVIITGKGCEPWMMVAGGKRISWDDRQVVREELKKLKKN